jgi:hypothetical protein
MPSSDVEAQLLSTSIYASDISDPVLFCFFGIEFFVS